MGSSVAGQIRIDLIAQAAQFSAGIRGGRQELGSFREEVDRLNKSFDSAKNAQKRFEQSEAAWETAMRRLGGSAADPLNRRRVRLEGDYLSTGFFDPLAGPGRIDQARRNEIRWKSMVPWGNSLRVELTREAAETAALLGSQKQTLIKEFSRSARELAGAGAGAMGFGGIFGKAAAFATSPMGAATIGLTAVAGTIAHAVREHDQIAREVRITAMRFGTSSESASRLRASGLDETHLFRFQRSMAQQSDEQTKGFRMLGLDPTAMANMPLEKALKSVSAGFEKIPNAADRAYAAFLLFGRGAGEVLGVLSRMEEKKKMMGEFEIIHPEDIERVKAWDKSLKGASNTLHDLSLAAGRPLGSHSGVGTGMMRMFEMLGTGSFWGSSLDPKKQKLLSRWAKEDAAIEAPQFHAMLRAGVDKDTVYRLEADYLAGRFTKEEYDRIASEKIDAMQENSERLEAQAEKRKDVDEKLRDLDRQLLGMEEGSAAEKRQKFLEAGIAAGLGNVASSGEPYGQLRDYMDRYDTATARIEGDKERKEREKELDREREREQDEAVRAEEDRFRRERDMKKRLRSPEEVAFDELRDMDEFRGSLTDAEYARGKRSIAEKLMGAIGGGEIQTVGMLSSGSAELHALVAKANMPDPKVALINQALRLLERIERGLQRDGDILD
jgi:hypothetical protein